ncbi:MAG: WD40/YVTN/BNR-like repeat-containing protein, partial [Nanobdellota archaeon]
GYGKIVTDIVKSSDSGENAVLYAGAATGVFKSKDGGRTWEEKSEFSEDYITCLKVNPDDNDTIYAGTKTAAVWYSTDGGDNWSQHESGLGMALRYTTPETAVTNTGDGTLNLLGNPGENAVTEKWTIECTETSEDGGTFSVTGSESGRLVGNYDISDGTYTTVNNKIEFEIKDGKKDFDLGDTFTFKTIRDPAKHIKDLEVYNNTIYALTYFNDDTEPHPVGNVYIADLAGDYSIDSDWKAANTGLPQYDPPDDTTFFAQHSIAVDDPDNPDALFIGGEGINFYKATSELGTDQTEWFESKQGITNLIMARTPVLFTGECNMDISKEVDGDKVTFYCYIEDKNGNPPISGSTFGIDDTGTKEPDDFYFKKYGDKLTDVGTFRDPSDPETDIPIEVTLNKDDITGHVKFKFVPAVNDESPGGSGAEQELTKFKNTLFPDP